MPRYLWQADDPVNRADIYQNLDFQYALLKPRDGLGRAEVDAIADGLRKKGYTVTPDVHAGENTLYVRGFAKSSELMHSLQDVQAVSGKPQQKEPLEIELHPDTRSWKQFVKENSIPLAGLTYLFADCMPIASGIVRKTPSEVLQGAVWASTSVMLMLCGRKDPTRQVGNMYSALEDYLQREDIPLNTEQADTIRMLKTQPTVVNKLVNAFYDYPIYINNSVQGLGGALQVYGGHKQGNTYKRTAGFGPMLGMWGGMLLPEDKYAGLDAQTRAANEAIEAEGGNPPDAFSARLAENPVAWIRNKPLRLSGIGPIFGNIMTAASVLFEDRHSVNQHFGNPSQKFDLNPGNWIKDLTRSKEQLMGDRFTMGDPATKHMLEVHRASQFTMMSPVFNIVANSLYMSSKDERSVNLYEKGYLDGIFALAADIYSHVPTEERAEKLLSFAGFMSQQPDMKLSQEQIKELVEEKIAGLEKSGWVANLNNEPKSQSHSIA
jgi:hypothetical protein